MLRRDFLLSGAALAVVGAAAPVAAQVTNSAARLWQIGPLIRRRNYSVNMPRNPTNSAEGWYFDFPGPTRDDGHVHYLTRLADPINRNRGIRLRYRIDARDGARFVPQEYADRPALLSLYIQRANDDWRGRGRTEFHRWYSPHDRVVRLEPGEHELTVLFSENWISVMGSDRVRSPEQFAEALADPGRIGFTFGSDRGRGHGIFATAPARFTVLEFAVI